MPRSTLLTEHILLLLLSSVVILLLPLQNVLPVDAFLPMGLPSGIPIKCRQRRSWHGSRCYSGKVNPNDEFYYYSQQQNLLKNLKDKPVDASQIIGIVDSSVQKPLQNRTSSSFSASATNSTATGGSSNSVGGTKSSITGISRGIARSSGDAGAGKLWRKDVDVTVGAPLPERVLQPLHAGYAQQFIAELKTTAVRDPNAAAMRPELLKILMSLLSSPQPLLQLRGDDLCDVLWCMPRFGCNMRAEACRPLIMQATVRLLNISSGSRSSNGIGSSASSADAWSSTSQQLIKGFSAVARMGVRYNRLSESQKFQLQRSVTLMLDGDIDSSHVANVIYR